MVTNYIVTLLCPSNYLVTNYNFIDVIFALYSWLVNRGVTLMVHNR